MNRLFLVAALILVAACSTQAATVTWNGLPITTLDVPSATISNVVVPLTEIPITEIDGVWYVTVHGELIKLPTIQVGGVQVPGTTVPNGSMWIQLVNGTQIELPVLQFDGVQIPCLPVDGEFIPLVVLRTLDKDIQAKSVGALLDRWIQVYGLLETPRVYKGNRFAVRAQVIKSRALRQGISDSILAECAQFAADLKAVTASR